MVPPGLQQQTETTTDSNYNTVICSRTVFISDGAKVENVYPSVLKTKGLMRSLIILLTENILYLVKLLVCCNTK